MSSDYNFILTTIADNQEYRMEYRVSTALWNNILPCLKENKSNIEVDKASSEN